MGYARVRPDLIPAGFDNPWVLVGLMDLDGNELHWRPDSEWVKAVAFDAMSTGNYVLTDDDDYYFVAYSADLEYKDEIPSKGEPMFVTSTPKPRERAKHAGHYDLRYDLAEARDTLFEQLGQDLDTWQLIARDLARDITRNQASTDDAFSFAYDVLNRLAHMPEMNIHPSEVRPTMTNRGY